PLAFRPTRRERCRLGRPRNLGCRRRAIARGRSIALAAAAAYRGTAFLPNKTPHLNEGPRAFPWFNGESPDRQKRRRQVRGGGVVRVFSGSAPRPGPSG